jgi:hypothetical protein
VKDCQIVQGSQQNVQGGIPVAVQHQPTRGADVRPHAQAFLHPFATARAILRGELGGDGHNGDAMQPAIVAHPGEKLPPTGIADTLCQMVILDEMGYLQVFKGYQVVRLDKRPCLLAGKVFTPPLNFEMLFRQPGDGFFAILGPFLFLGDAPLQALQVLFGFAQGARVGYRIACGVSIKGFQPHIDAHLFAGRDMLNSALCLDGELHLEAIGTLEETNALDVRHWEGFDAALLADQLHASDAHAKGVV